MRSSKSAWKPKEDRFVPMEPVGLKQTHPRRRCTYIYIYLLNLLNLFNAGLFEHRLHSDLWICRKAGKVGADSRGPGEEPLHCRKGSQSAAVRAPCQTWIIQGFLRSEVSWGEPVLKYVLCISTLTRTCNPSFLQATMNWAKRKLDEPPCYRDNVSLMHRFFAMTAVFQLFFLAKQLTISFIAATLPLHCEYMRVSYISFCAIPQ